VWGRGILFAMLETITIRVSPETKRRLAQAAQARGVSLETLVAEALERAASSEWPESVRQLVGAWGDDFPEPESLRRSLEQESHREQP